jgi:hypothetical protein
VKQNGNGNPVYETEAVFTIEEVDRAKNIVRGNDLSGRRTVNVGYHGIILEEGKPISSNRTYSVVFVNKFQTEPGAAFEDYSGTAFDFYERENNRSVAEVIESISNNEQDSLYPNIVDEDDKITLDTTFNVEIDHKNGLQYFVTDSLTIEQSRKLVDIIEANDVDFNQAGLVGFRAAAYENNTENVEDVIDGLQ